MYEGIIVTLDHILQSCANMQGNCYLYMCTYVLHYIRHKLTVHCLKTRRSCTVITIIINYTMTSKGSHVNRDSLLRNT